MAEYIKRQEAKDACLHAWAKDLEPTQFIDAIAAADVVEVVQGQWESKSVLVGYMKFEYFYECTACGRRGTNYKTNYCPNCGARMDGDTDG